METSVRVEPPTESDIQPYFVKTALNESRFDVLEFKSHDGVEYKQVLAIFTLRRRVENGYYKCRKKQYSTRNWDTFFICADMVQITPVGVQKLIPYPIFKLRTGSNC